MGQSQRVTVYLRRSIVQEIDHGKKSKSHSLPHKVNRTVDRPWDKVKGPPFTSEGQVYAVDRQRDKVKGPQLTSQCRCLVDRPWQEVKGPPLTSQSQLYSTIDRLWQEVKEPPLTLEGQLYSRKTMARSQRTTSYLRRSIVK
jgi:hypothetical protein